MVWGIGPKTLAFLPCFEHRRASESLQKRKFPCIFPVKQGIDLRDEFAGDWLHRQRPRRSSLFIAWRGQAAGNRACFAVNLNSEPPNAGAFPAIAGVPGVRSPRARCKGEFGGNREFFAITASIQGDCSELPTKKKKLSFLSMTSELSCFSAEQGAFSAKQGEGQSISGKQMKGTGNNPCCLAVVE